MFSLSHTSLYFDGSYEYSYCADVPKHWGNFMYMSQKLSKLRTFPSKICKIIFILLIFKKSQIYLIYYLFISKLIINLKSTHLTDY